MTDVSFAAYPASAIKTSDGNILVAGYFAHKLLHYLSLQNTKLPAAALPNIAAKFKADVAALYPDQCFTVSAAWNGRKPRGWDSVKHELNLSYVPEGYFTA
jgi:hypothetical protein